MRSIRLKLFILLVIMGSIPLMIVLVVDGVSTINELEAVIYKDGMLRNSIVSRHITELCEKNFHVLHTLALNSQIQQYIKNPLPENRLQIAELLHNTNNIFDDQNVMAITGADAVQIMRTDGSGLVNVKNREHFQKAMRGKDFVSDVIVSMSTGKMIVVLEVPVINDKAESIGMLQRNFNLIELQRFVKFFDDRESSIVIIDSEGRIIADSDKVFDSALEYIDDKNYEFVSRRIREDSKTYGTIQTEFAGTDYLVSYSRNHITGWIVFVIQPYSYIWEQVFIKVARVILVGLIMLMIVGYFANKMSYKATKPILEITNAAEEIAHGNKSVEKIEISSDDELSKMADAFNKMRTLRDTYQIASEVDKLTKLYNKATTEKICKLKLLEFDKLEDPKPLTAFFIIDLDHFKQANDTFGHQFGDKILVEFSSKIRKIFRPNDCLGRFGGDEFIVILDNLPSVDIVVRKAEGIKQIAAELTIDEVNAGITASIGISIVPQQGTNYDTLFKTADEELYKVKANGRNGYSYNYAESVSKD